MREKLRLLLPVGIIALVLFGIIGWKTGLLRPPHPDELTFQFINLCGEEDYESAAQLLAKHPDIAKHSMGVGQTPLHLMVKAPPEAVDLLLDAGADLNAEEGRGLTALDYFMNWGGNEDTFRHLVSKGARFGGPRSTWDPLEILEKVKAGDPLPTLEPNPVEP